MSVTESDRRLSRNAYDFIDDDYLSGLLGPRVPERQVHDVIAKSLAKEPLTVEETAILINAEEPELVESVFEAARQLKRDVYGNRIVLFAPLYIGNDASTTASIAAFADPICRRFAARWMTTNCDGRWRRCSARVRSA